MIVVTGGAGFIGSNFVRFLNDKGIDDIVIVDDLTDGKKFKNLSKCSFSAYFDKDEFIAWLIDSIYVETQSDEDLHPLEQEGVFASDVKCIVHLGACSVTTEWNGKKMMDENYRYSTELMTICQNGNIPFIYASSASVYGNEKAGATNPLNVYAFSKLTIDQYITKYVTNFNKLNYEESKKDPDYEPPPFTQTVGLRIFNCYGPNEGHKKDQASPVHKFTKKALNNEVVELFEVDAKRDFVYVDDVCEVIWWFINNENSGIFDVGTGAPRSFDEVATALKKAGIGFEQRKVGFPDRLAGHYQYFTQANLEPLRQIGCNHKFMSLEEGIEKFLERRQ